MCAREAAPAGVTGTGFCFWGCSAGRLQSEFREFRVVDSGTLNPKPYNSGSSFVTFPNGASHVCLVNRARKSRRAANLAGIRYCPGRVGIRV